MRVTVLVATSLLVAAMLAGCVADVDDYSAEISGAAAADEEGLPPLDVSATNCREGGGHSVHPKRWNPLPEPYVPADVIDDVGPQIAYSEIPDPTSPVPQKGGTIGNYHATMLCEGWIVNGEAREGLLFGFVGMKIEAPAWSDDAPTHHYLATVFATNDDDLHHVLHEAGFHPMRSTGRHLDLGAGLLRIQMETDHNGEYDSIFKPTLHGEMQAAHVRIWFQHDNGDNTWTPLALDLFATGGEHYIAEGQGYFSHMGTHHHGPQQGGGGKTAALYYAGFDRTFAWGPQAWDVRVDGYYDH